MTTGAPGWLSWLIVRLLILTQVMISLFVSSNPASSSVLTAGSPLGFSLSFSPCPAPPNKQINIKKKKKSLETW